MTDKKLPFKPLGKIALALYLAERSAPKVIKKLREKVEELDEQYSERISRNGR